MVGLLSRVKNATSFTLRAIRALRRRHTHDWLSDRVKKEAREYRKAHYTREGVRDRLRRTSASGGFWCCVVAAIVLIVALSVCVYCLAPTTVHGDRWYGLLTTLWQIEASLAGITFVIAALLLESRAREARSNDIFSYYIGSCRLIPLVVATFLHILLIGVLAYLRYGSCLRGALLDVGLIAISIGFVPFVVSNVLLWIKVLRLLGPLSLLEARESVTLKAVETAIPGIAAEILGRGLLHAYLTGRNVDYRVIDAGDERVLIRSSVAGFVTDIDLARTEEALADIGTTYSGSRAPVSLLRNVGDPVSEGQPLAAIRPECANDLVVTALQRAFRVRQDRQESRDVLERALRGLKEDIEGYLEARQVGMARRALDLLPGILRQMVVAWRAQQFRVQIPETPQGYYFSGPMDRPLRILRSTLRACMEQAVEEGDRELVDATVGVLRETLGIASDLGQKRLFRLLSSTLVAVYRQSLIRAEDDFRNTVLAIWHLSMWSFAHYHLAPKLADVAMTRSLAQKATAYLCEMVQMYSHLLRSATDLADAASFASFAQTLDGLWFDSGEGDQVSLAGALTTESCDRIVWRDLAWFGIGAWTLKRLMDGALSSEVGAGMLKTACDHLSDFDRLHGLHRQIQQRHRQLSLRFGWDDWATRPTERPGASFPNVDGWMRTFYCFHGTYLLSPELATGGADYYRAKLQGKDGYEAALLETACQQIRAARDRLVGVIDAETLSQLIEFADLHRPGDDPPRSDG